MTIRYVGEASLPQGVVVDVSTLLALGDGVAYRIQNVGNAPVETGNFASTPAADASGAVRLLPATAVNIEASDFAPLYAWTKAGSSAITVARLTDAEADDGIETDSTLDGDGTTSDPLGVADGGIASAQLADAAVGTPQLADHAVTSAKLADGVVTPTSEIEHRLAHDFGFEGDHPSVVIDPAVYSFGSLSEQVGYDPSNGSVVENTPTNAALLGTLRELIVESLHATGVHRFRMQFATTHSTLAGLRSDLDQIIGNENGTVHYDVGVSFPIDEWTVAGGYATAIADITSSQYNAVKNAASNNLAVRITSADGMDFLFGDGTYTFDGTLGTSPLDQAAADTLGRLPTTAQSDGDYTFDVNSIPGDVLETNSTPDDRLSAHAEAVVGAFAFGESADDAIVEIESWNTGSMAQGNLRGYDGYDADHGKVIQQPAGSDLVTGIHALRTYTLSDGARFMQIQFTTSATSRADFEAQFEAETDIAPIWVNDDTFNVQYYEDTAQAAIINGYVVDMEGLRWDADDHVMAYQIRITQTQWLQITNSGKQWHLAVAKLDDHDDFWFGDNMPRLAGRNIAAHSVGAHQLDHTAIPDPYRIGAALGIAATPYLISIEAADENRNDGLTHSRVIGYKRDAVAQGSVNQGPPTGAGKVANISEVIELAVYQHTNAADNISYYGYLELDTDAHSFTHNIAIVHDALGGYDCKVQWYAGGTVVASMPATWGKLADSGDDSRLALTLKPDSAQFINIRDAVATDATIGVAVISTDGHRTLFGHTLALDFAHYTSFDLPDNSVDAANLHASNAGAFKVPFVGADGNELTFTGGGDGRVNALVAHGSVSNPVTGKLRTRFTGGVAYLEVYDEPAGIWRNLGSGTPPAFDLHDNVGTKLAAGQIADADRWVVTDESADGDPMRYTSTVDLVNRFAGTEGGIEAHEYGTQTRLRVKLDGSSIERTSSGLRLRHNSTIRNRSDVTDLNAATSEGWFDYSASATHAPNAHNGFLLVLVNGDFIWQEAREQTGAVYVWKRRSSDGGSTWNAWVREGS